MSKLVSVVVPVYNVEKYLRRCIDSILKQDYGNIEVLLVDDGSTDASGNLCDEYALKDERVRVFHQTNQGAMVARKNAIENALGDAITFVDADDEIKINYISALLRDSDNVDCVISATYWVTKEGKKILEKSHMEAGIYRNSKLDYLLSNMMVYKMKPNQYGILPFMCAKLFKTDKAKKIIRNANMRIGYGDDWTFVAPYVLSSNAISIIDDSNYYYYQREDSICNKDNPEFLRDLGELYVSLYELFKNHMLSVSLLKQLEVYTWTRLAWIPNSMGWQTKDLLGEWTPSLFSNLPGKRIALYGAGKIGQSLFKQLKANEEYELVIWVDKDNDKLKQEGFNVSNADDLLNQEFDAVIVGVGNKNKDEVVDWLKVNGIPDEKIVCRKWEKKFILA